MISPIKGHEVPTLIAVTFLMVMAVDNLSALLRRTLAV